MSYESIAEHWLHEAKEAMGYVEIFKADYQSEDNPLSKIPLENPQDMLDFINTTLEKYQRLLEYIIKSKGKEV